MCSSLHNFLKFFGGKLIFLRYNFRKSEEKSYQIENYLEKSQNFTMCTCFSEKHHGVNSIAISFYL